jgi:uncharacterized protein
MLLLNLGTIRTPHERFEHLYNPEALDTRQDTFDVVAPIALAFDIRKDGNRFQLTGRVRTTLSLPCSRCLEPFEWPVDAEFDLRYEPRGQSVAAQEREIQDEDFSAAVYEDDTIDLGQLMREQFYLSLPMKPLCTEACRGLCSQCGTNLNRGTCDCQPGWEDPRLAALRALKRDS